MIGANPERKKARPLATFPLAQIKRVCLVKRADGYYVQFAVQTERKTAHQPTGKQVGIDVGLKSFYTGSDGQTVDNPRYLRKAEQKRQTLASARLPHTKTLQEPQTSRQTAGQRVSESE